jgi:hypothetical protein
MDNLAPICALQLVIDSLAFLKRVGIERMDARALELVSHIAPLGTAGIQSLEVCRLRFSLPELQALGAAMGGSVRELTIIMRSKNSHVSQQLKAQLPQWFPHVGSNYRLSI